MANGMGALFVGNSGLHSAQDAINITANNLTNVNTPGYVRQQVVFRDTDYNNLAYSKNLYKKLTGLGTSIGDIVHARDVFLDKAYRTENGRKAYYETSFEAVDEVQSYFQELEGKAFQQTLTGEESLWEAFEELAKAPDDTVQQNLVVQRADLFVSRAQAVYSGLVNYQANINTQISDTIDAINELAEQIYDLNDRIQAIEASGRETAMNERDARDYALDQLSRYGSIYYDENTVGVVTVKFEGETLVDESHCYEMGKKIDKVTGYITPYWPHLSNESVNHYVEVLDYTREISTENDTDIGALKALVQARGTETSNYLSMLIDADEYDATVGLSIMQNTEAEFDHLIHGIVTSINDLLAPNKTLDALYVQNSDGTYTRYNNVQVLDTENCCVGADGELPPQELFVRDGTQRYTTVTGQLAPDGEVTTYYIYNQEDWNDSADLMLNGKTYKSYDMDKATTITQCDANGDPIIGTTKPYEPWDKEDNQKYIPQVINGLTYYIYNPEYRYDEAKQYTVGSISINHELKKQVTNFPHINNKDEIDYELASNLTAIWSADLLNINPRYSTKYSFTDYYQEMIGEIGVIGTMYQTTSETLSNTVESVSNQRTSVIGVSSDEELTKMIKYQNAYNAASRYIQVVSDMLEALINGL